MAATLFVPTTILASGGGLLYAFEQSTLPGRFVLMTLFIGSVLAWTVMVTKFRVIRDCLSRHLWWADSRKAQC